MLNKVNTLIEPHEYLKQTVILFFLLRMLQALLISDLMPLKIFILLFKKTYWESKLSFIKSLEKASVILCKAKQRGKGEEEAVKKLTL